MPQSPTDSRRIIDIQGLVKHYRGLTAVNNIDLHVNEGEIFGILGPNGAGKTTTLEMIEGLRTPDAGTITVDGLDAVRDSAQIRKRIGVQLQSTSLFPYLNARELVELFGNMYDIADPSTRAEELLRSVNLADKATARVDQLSGGQQQRLSIALALVNSPRVTFLDEPTTGLDPQARRNLWQTILDVRAQGTTVVLTTHYMDEAQILCDRIAIMDAGKIVACDTPERLINALPQDAVITATIPADVPAQMDASVLCALPGATHATTRESETDRVYEVSTSDVQATMIALLDAAGRAGVTFTQLASTRASLEDVFLASTGRTYDAGNEPAAQPETGRRRRRRR